MEQHTTKFKFNIVDAIIILAVVAVLAGIGYKLFAPTIQNQTAPLKEVEVVMRIRGAMPYMISELESDPDRLANQPLVAGVSYQNAQVTKFEIVDYIVQLPTDAGTIEVANDPQKKDILVYVSAQVQDAAVIKIANQEVRAGRTFILKTQRFESEPTVESVTFK